MPQPIWQPGRWQRTPQLWRGMVFVLRSMATRWLTALQRAPAEKLKWERTLRLTSWPLWSQESCTQCSSGPIRALVPVGRAWLRPRRVSSSPSGWGFGALPSVFISSSQAFPQGILPLGFDLSSFSVDGRVAISAWFFFFWQSFCLSNKAFACIPSRKYLHCVHLADAQYAFYLYVCYLGISVASSSNLPVFISILWSHHFLVFSIRKSINTLV